MTAASFLPHLAPQDITGAEARWLTRAVDSDSAMYGDGRSAARDHARRLASRGLVTWLDWREAGWEPGMWGATVTCPGFNALWRHNGDRHTPGCGGRWLADGTCDGCATLRRLDLDAWETFRLATAEDVDRSALWCDEHGYLRRSQWRTTKTCGLSGGSSQHDGGLQRVGAS